MSIYAVINSAGMRTKLVESLAFIPDVRDVPTQHLISYYVGVYLAYSQHEPDYVGLYLAN